MAKEFDVNAVKCIDRGNSLAKYIVAPLPVLACGAPPPALIRRFRTHPSPDESVFFVQSTS